MASERAQILITAIDQTRQAFASVKGNLEGLSGAAGKLNGLLAGLGAALSLGALVAAGRHALNAADDLAKLAQKTGISVESLAVLKPIAEQSGVSLEGLANGIKKLSVSMFEANAGTKEQVEVFRRLGVSVKDTAGQLRPTEAVLLDLAEAFAAMPDGAEKSALAVKIFGKSGVELIPFLNQGKAGIEALKQQFKALGLEISGDTAKAAEKFNDTLDTVKQALHGIALKVMTAALPALQQLADKLVALASHSEEIMTGLRLLGEVLVIVFAVKGVQAVLALAASLATLKVALARLWPVMVALAAIEFGQMIGNAIDDARATDQVIADSQRTLAHARLLQQSLRELAQTGAVSVKTQMALAAIAAEELKASLPAVGNALRGIRGAATQAGEAIRQAFEAEGKKATETIKQLSVSYRQVSADIKAIWDARVAEIESNAQRQTAAAQNTARSEAVSIRDSAQTLLAAEREKLAVVEAGARQMASAWQAAYGQAVALARAAGQNVQAVERQGLEARISLYGQMETAYRATVDRLIAEENRHLQAAKVADEARLNLRLSVEDRIRELSRKGMDEAAAYQDRLRQIDEKQAQARAALAAGNFEQARKLAEESIALAERSASAVTRQIEQDGKTITQTVVSEGQAAASAIGQIKESAALADQALAGLGNAHRQAAAAAKSGADEAQRSLAGVAAEIAQLREQLLSADQLKLNIDLDAAQGGIDTFKALIEAQTLIAKIQVDTQAAEAALDKFKSDTGNLTLLATVEADSRKLLADIDSLKSTLSNAKVDIPALVSFEQPRQELLAFAQNAHTVLSAPTTAVHTPQPDLNPYRAALAELTRPTSSVHTVYVRQVQANALGGLIRKLAAGGQALNAGFRRLSGKVFGPGTETSDSVPALLSQGEYIIRAASVKKFGADFFAALNAGFLPAWPRFAMGSALLAAANRSAAQEQTTPAQRDIVDLNFHLGGKTYAAQSSRQVAMQLAQALRELSRGA